MAFVSGSRDSMNVDFPVERAPKRKKLRVRGILRSRWTIPNNGPPFIGYGQAKTMNRLRLLPPRLSS